MEFVPPKDRKANLLYRIELLQRAEDDPELQELILAKMATDPIWAIDSFFWTYDPRLPDPTIPFILYPKQEKLIFKLEDCLKRSKLGETINLVLDKPRDVGATFTVVAWILTKVLSQEFSARIGSRNEDYVDKTGNTDSLFYKLDVQLNRLPKWMVGAYQRSHMMFKGGKGEVIGEATNPNFARGGRKTVILFDEHGFWDVAKSSWESAGEATNFRISMSTPPETGADSFFHKLLTGKQGAIEKFVFDWTDVPTRDEKWLEQKRANKSEEEFAREVLKSYEGTIEGRVYAVALQHADIGDHVEYNPALPLFVSWDFGRDTTYLIWWQKDFRTDQLYIIDSYHNMNKSIDFYVPFVTGILASGIYEYDVTDLQTISRHWEWKKEITHFGDPDVDSERVADDTTTNKVLQKHGIYVQTKAWAGRSWYKDMREKTALSFRRVHINENRNEHLISALRQSAYPKRTEGSQATTEPLKPIHNWTSHPRTAYEYFIDNEPSLDRFARRAERERLEGRPNEVKPKTFDPFSVV